ncbi:unnamed protein product [Lampetra planeri]
MLIECVELGSSSSSSNVSTSRADEESIRDWQDEGRGWRRRHSGVALLLTLPEAYAAGMASAELARVSEQQQQKQQQQQRNPGFGCGQAV